MIIKRAYIGIPIMIFGAVTLFGSILYEISLMQMLYYSLEYKMFGLLLMSIGYFFIITDSRCRRIKND